MSEIAHPAAREELAHLESTKLTISGLRVTADEALKKATDELSVAARFDPDMLPVREMLYSRAAQTVRNLSLSYARPYFTRVDFAENGGEKQTYYIGKNGVMKPDLLEVVVVDWRAPIANLYYSGQVGPMNYTAPDGEVKGELTLKRQLGVEDGELKTIFDTDVASRDAYLQSVLGSMSGDRLRDIVTSIQAEQNFVIRHPLERSLIVQGVAGSGKTTIALHRIAYLLYAFSERLRPEHMLILAPNPLFLNFIAGVLPDLGVERVKQTTFAACAREWLGSALPKGIVETPLEKVINMPEAQREEVARVARAKGALAMEARLNGWLDAYEARFPLKGDIKFGPVTLFTEAQTRQFLLEDEKFFPLARRMAEFQKALKRRLKDAAAQVKEWLRAETEKRADKLRVGERDPQKRVERMHTLYASRDARLKEVDERVVPFVKEVMKRFPETAPAALYRLFMADMANSSDPDMALAAEHTLELPVTKLAREDIAPVLLIALRAIELKKPDIRHVVVDEAQDFSPLEFLMLKRMTGSASMTIVGDLMQGVRAYRGLTDWRELTEGLFEGAAVMHHLVTSYRSTIEIMETALRVAAKRPTPGQQDARPVLRHGEKPEFVRFASSKEQQAALVEIIDRWTADGVKNIAVIDRTDAQVAAIMKALPERLNAKLLDVEHDEFAGGLLVARASDVKGFEFDGVIVADVSPQRYPDRELDARLLYVCLTRPLHRLACLYDRELTPLLA